jgi:hypothetical protein
MFTITPNELQPTPNGGYLALIQPLSRADGIVPGGRPVWPDP